METLTYSLTNERDVKRLISPEVASSAASPVALAMPMSEDHKYLRLSILPELLNVLSYNRARSQVNLGYYEMGSIFISGQNELSEQPDEQLRISGALTGTWSEQAWQQEKKEVDFYVVKGIVEGLFDFLQIPVTYSQTKVTDMHPGRCAVVKIADKTVGFIGQLHPTLQKQLDLKETYVFDLNLEEVFAAYDAVPSFTAIPKFPSIARDIAFILDKNVHAGDVKKVIEEVGAPLVNRVDIFDLYQGDNLEKGKKSIAYSLLYQHPEKTLKDEEVEESYQKIIAAVNEKFNAYVRS